MFLRLLPVSSIVDLGPWRYAIMLQWCSTGTGLSFAQTRKPWTGVAATGVRCWSWRLPNRWTKILDLCKFLLKLHPNLCWASLVGVHACWLSHLAQPALLPNPLQTPRVAEKGGGGGVGWCCDHQSLQPSWFRSGWNRNQALIRWVAVYYQACRTALMNTNTPARAAFALDSKPIPASCSLIPDTSFRYPNYTS